MPTPTLAQLRAEPWWGREVITPELSWLGAELCRRTGRPRDAWGDKGNEAHLSGGHRSQEWIKNSDYCENRSYTAQTGLTAEQLRHIAAGDFTPGNWGTPSNRALMVKHTKALFAEARAGRLNGLRQIFGTLDGRNATGLNVLTNSTTVPDASHLDHLHMTFDRTRMRDSALMAKIANIIAPTGDDEDMSDAYNLLDSLTRTQSGGSTYTPPGADAARYGSLSNSVAIASIQKAEKDARIAADAALALKAMVDKLSIPAPVPVDPAALKAAVDAALESRFAAFADLLESRVRDAVADGLEGGSAKVRADAD